MRQSTGILILVTALACSACGGGGGVKPAARQPAPVAPGDDAPRSKYGNPASYEVYGKTYHVLDTARGYRETGLASWYGEDFHGKRTSSGEPYNMHAMTAAHKTLPLPTYVRVTNLRNRREIIVRVNDRGPFVDDRIIDLSFAAATELDIVRSGTVEVEVTTVDPVLAAADAPPARSPTPPARRETAPPVATTGEPASQVLAPDEIPVSARRDVARESEPVIRELPPDESSLAVTQAQTGKPVSAGRHYLQAGAFSESRNADALVEKLRKAGLETARVYPAGPLLKVRLGPYPDLSSMESDRARLSALGIRPHLVEE